jgi:hypothetical protein
MIFGGEGLFLATLRGYGTVWLQSLPFARLADRMLANAPASGTVPFKVNAKYPESQPLPSVPANLLLTLPSLPAPLEYRIVGKHLLILDMAADLVVDYMLNVMP